MIFANIPTTLQRRRGAHGDSVEDSLRAKEPGKTAERLNKSRLQDDCFTRPAPSRPRSVWRFAYTITGCVRARWKKRRKKTKHWKNSWIYCVEVAAGWLAGFEEAMAKVFLLYLCCIFGIYLLIWFIRLLWIRKMFGWINQILVGSIIKYGYYTDNQIFSWPNKIFWLIKFGRLY